jgi:signal transduction protein with GAF and PtsI domain
MIDPVTIGIAFTAAQQSVNYIKKAIALGKDVNSLYGQFAKFFENSDKVHSANVAAQGANAILTDGQIRAMSIQVAMHSKALRDAEKELKDLLIYTGNADVWNEMMAERIRLYKERARLEREKKEAEAKAKADLIDNILIFISFVVIIVPVFGICFALLIR